MAENVTVSIPLIPDSLVKMDGKIPKFKKQGTILYIFPIILHTEKQAVHFYNF